MSVFPARAMRVMSATAMHSMNCRGVHHLTAFTLPYKSRTLHPSLSPSLFQPTLRHLSSDGVKKARSKEEHSAGMSATASMISEKEYNALADATLEDICDLLDVLDEIGDDEVGVCRCMYYMCECVCPVCAVYVGLCLYLVTFNLTSYALSPSSSSSSSSSPSPSSEPGGHCILARCAEHQTGGCGYMGHQQANP
jgi:hypothetical protein